MLKLLPLVIVPIGFSLSMFYSSYVLKNAPVSFRKKDEVTKYPMYESKKAEQSEENWEKSQKLYSEELKRFGIINLIMGLLILVALLFLSELKPSLFEDGALATILIIAPEALMFIFANVKVEWQLKEEEKAGEKAGDKAGEKAED